MTSLMTRILLKPRVVFAIGPGHPAHFCPSHFSATSDVTYIRHINPLRENRDNVVEDLSDRLRQKFPLQYSFLSKDLQFEVEVNSQDEILEIAKHLKEPNDTNVEDKCLSLFESWMTKSKLSLAYYMFANKDVFYSKEFMIKVVKHLSQDISSKLSNNHEELVALWLCLYFSQKIWTVEEIYEHLDFGQIQERLATLIGQNLLSNAEICCIFFGMKKISGLEIFDMKLRQALYRHITRSAADEDRDLLISMVLPILIRGKHSNKGVDEGDMINFLRTLGVSRENLATSSIIQIVNHGISFGDSVNDESMTGELLKRLSQGGNHVKSLSINELKKVLKYLSRIPLEGHDSGIVKQSMTNIGAELKVISDMDCQLTDTRDLLQCLMYLTLTFDTIVEDKLKSIWEAVNEIPDFNQYTGKEMSKRIIISIHEKLFPNSSNDLDQQFKDFFQRQTEETCRLLVNLEKSYLVLQPDLIGQIGQIQADKSKHLIKIVQTPAPSVDIVTNVKQRKHKQNLAQSLTRRQNEITRIFTIMSENLLHSDDYVSVVHVLPHFQEPDIVFGQIAGMAMSLPDELKNDDQEIKRPPIVGEWFVVSPTKVSKSKRKLLKALGFTIVDMTEWQKTAKNDPKMPKDRAENYMIAKSNISRMVASCLSGNYHEKPPNPRAVPDYGS